MFIALAPGVPLEIYSRTLEIYSRTPGWEPLLYIICFDASRGNILQSFHMG
jgi:hypothetical protein